MSWAKLDDGFWMHPKVVHGGNEAAGIFARYLSYCGAYLTDGLVPEPVALTIAGSIANVDRMVELGFVERLATGSVVVTDYTDYNPLRIDVQHEREARKERASKAAKARWKGNGDA